MKTKKKLTFILLLSLLMFIPLTLFTSCNNDKSFDGDFNKNKAFQNLKIIVDENLFNKTMSRLASSRSYGEISDNDIWQAITTSFFIVKDNENILISDYFSEFDKNESESKDLILGKIFLFDHFDQPQTRAKKELTLEEIRNAMIEECENGYMEPITSACKAAVLIAYYYKKLVE